MQDPDLTLLQIAAEKAGDISLKYFRHDPENWEKAGDLGPVSAADLEIDHMLSKLLSRERPNYGWLSEETEDNDARLKKETVFIIDPIDGTRAFLEGNENFSNSLAIAKNGKITAAVVHVPAKQQTFTATLNGGAYLNGKPIRHSKKCNLNGARILTTRPNLRPDYWKNGAPDVELKYRSSLAYRLCLVAQGRYDGMFTFRPTWEWDVAAGDLICTEAGVCVTTADNNTTTYNSATPQLAGMIASAPEIHPQIMKHRLG